MSNRKPLRVPALLPNQSRATEAQKLNDRPQEAMPGAYYTVPHHRPYPTGWRIRRHVKRKNLHRSNHQYLLTDRRGLRWVLLPLASSVLSIIIMLATLLVTFTAMVAATQQRYGQQITSLVDILPKDNLKMYDKHGTLIYQMVDQGLQTTVPLSEISPQL